MSVRATYFTNPLPRKARQGKDTMSVRTVLKTVGKNASLPQNCQKTTKTTPHMQL